MIQDEIMARYALESSYTKDEIEGGLFRYVKAFYLKDTDPDWQDSTTVEVTHLLLTKQKFIKTEMIRIGYSVFDNEEVYRPFLKSLPWYLPIAIEKLLWRESLTNQELEVAIRKEVSKMPNANLAPTTVFDLSMFTRKTDYGYGHSNSQGLCLTKEMKRLITKYYTKPPYHDFVALETIPETAAIYNGQKQIFEELPHIISYHLLGNIKFSASGRPVESTLGKFQKTCGIDEFYGFGTDSLSKVRCNLIAGMLFDLTQKDIDLDSIEVIKHLFKKRYPTLFSAQFILTQFKGWNFISAYPDRQNDVEAKLLTVLPELPLHDWVSIENLAELLEYRFINAKPIQAQAAQTKLYYEEEIPFAEAKKIYVSADNYIPLIVDPFLKGTIFLFASFGLMEIAFDNVDNTKIGSTYFSNYDGLKYFKLTPLGAYILGITSKFENDAPTEKNKLTLSTDSMMIIADGNLTAITDLMLSTYSEKLGNTRYRVSAQTFLKDCKNRKEIESKIALFKATINGTIPTFWERFFKELLTNASAIKINKFVQTYTLPAEDKELHKLVAQDSTLKQLTLKAEGFNLLVPVENLVKFRSRMKELGFIIE